ncbi:MAG: 1-acyl-sn-glycerol-3-phosphate acyltransferase [Rhodobacteraceae bacterium]|nr:1-acyl-sn-glycerol-3-phosphate acyltransferase [Paracoccaceae bacterium]
MNTPAWDNGSRPDQPPITVAGWARAVLRGLPIIFVIFGLLPFVILLRATGHSDHARRIVCFASRITLRIMGLRLRLSGTVAPNTRVFVANHSSWLDIFVLTAAQPMNFVSKAEVAGWPGIGLVARSTGTVFIARRRVEAIVHRDQLAARLASGDRLMIFPEGTSTDGRRVLPFRPTLFAALQGKAFEGYQVQPVSVRYAATAGRDSRLYGWWGDMDFAPHFLAILALEGHGSVQVRFGTPLSPADFADRKALAAAAEAAVRGGFDALALGETFRNCP